MRLPDHEVPLTSETGEVIGTVDMVHADGTVDMTVTDPEAIAMLQPDTLQVSMGAESSRLLGRLKGTFEPRNAKWLKTNHCKACGSGTLKVPRIPPEGTKMLTMQCPTCGYVNIEILANPVRSIEGP